MVAATATGLLKYLAPLEDPRSRRGQRFAFTAMLANVICALLCGMSDYEGIAEWVKAQDPSVWHWLGYFRRPPKAGAFRYLLNRIRPEVLECAVRAWVAGILGPTALTEALQAVALDGKSLCGTLSLHQQTIHLLALLDQQTGCVLSQARVADKTNEITAAPELLRSLVLTGRVITADAMHCQRETARTIIDSGGDYLLVVKDNQAELKDAIVAEFAPGFSPGKRSDSPN